MKMLHSFKYIFFCVFLTYSISPIGLNFDNTSINGLANDQEFSVFKKILLIEKLFSAIHETKEAGDTGDTNAESDLLLKRTRILPAYNSLGKQIFAEGNISKINPLFTEDILLSKQYVFLPYIKLDTVPVPFKGYGALHSGLAPPYLLS